MRRRISTGSDYEKLVGYSRALVVGEWVFVSGTTGRNHETGEIPADVVRARIIMTDAADDARVAPVIGEYLKPVGPALTSCVAQLLDPRLKIEIDVTALIGSGQKDSR